MSHRIALLAIALGASSLACTYVEHHHHAPPPHAVEVRQGPPPHAPAHGYRHKHPGPAGSVDLVFDSGLGVYVVVGWPGYYWHQDHYYRFVEGAWMISTRLDAGWVSCSSGKVPPGLVKKHAGPGHKGKGKHPAKHGY
jgi:hypothetical protein